jgi:hypothetical protein
LLHCWFVVLFSPLLVRTPLFQISLLFLFISLAQTRFPLSAPFLLQRSWTMLTFHHHLARAIMHLNYLYHSLNHPLNGTTQSQITISDQDAQTQLQEASILLSPYLPRPTHQRWYLMEAFRLTWS